MKKKILSLAVAAGLVGAVSAQAEMHINPNGLGEALIYPFYSAANGNDTLVSIVNTTGLTKAVKVRFIEALNSQEVLDFNLYLSPEDVWTGVVTANPRGEGAIIRTADTSCTVPQLGLNAAPGYTHFNGWVEDGVKNQPFVNYKYGVKGKDPLNPELDLVPDTESFQGLDRTLEGYIEVIEMGQLDPEDEGFGQAAVHTPAGVPNNCATLVNAWTQGGSGNGTWLGGGDNSQIGLLQGEDGWAANAGGLYGYGVVVNIPEGTASGYDAIAIEAFNSDEDLQNLHYQPGYEFPSLQNANEVATIFDGIYPETIQYSTGADAVSALFMSTSIANDYVIDPSINANTDWVITMPTKRFYVQSTPALTPFTNSWATSESPEPTAGACEQIVYEYWDREEANIAPVDIVNPPLPSPLPPFIPTEIVGINLCTEVTVVSFGEDSALNASENIRLGLPTGEYTEGWARISFDNLSTRVLPGDGPTLRGLPVVGFAVFEYQNGSVGGVLSNYGSSATHKSEVGITQAP
ncbi:MAG: hypothetical protein M0P11_08765 [Anaerolineaceae bacterium]|nr:hypothetical protein [Anaerolineaceae bacterium]